MFEFNSVENAKKFTATFEYCGFTTIRGLSAQELVDKYVKKLQSQ